MGAILKGTLLWPEEKTIMNCETLSLGGQGDMYKFIKAEARKIQGGYILQSITLDRWNRYDKAKKLVVGDWVLFDSNGDIHSPRSLACIMSNPSWEGQGVKPNETCGRDTYDNGTLIVDFNEVALYVMWYEKINIDSDELKFHM